MPARYAYCSGCRSAGATLAGRDLHPLKNRAFPRHTVTPSAPTRPTGYGLGDKWSLLIIRDVMFGNRRHFRELLNKSEEGISSNILSDRLKTLLDEGIITRADDPTHKQKGIQLTEQGIELLPILAQMAAWSYKYLSVTDELGIRAKLLSDGGPTMWAEMDELREIHLGLKPKRRTGPSVGERLRAA